MSRIVWMTDLHLNFAKDAARDALIEQLHEAGPDHLLVGGDMAEAESFVSELEWLADACHCPVSFVLGNHDYYQSSIKDVRDQATKLAAANDNILWLPMAGVVPLAPDTALIGHGGWADARAGDWSSSNVMLNDYLLIDELRSMELTVAVKLKTTPDPRLVLNDKLRERLESLGDEAAAHLRQTATDALAEYRHVIVLMHVPPFVEACWHEGRTSDDNWVPHFTCAAAGAALREVMAAHPDQTMTVLCGHTHSGGEAQILPNLNVVTGGAHYGRPEVQRVFETGTSMT